MNQKYKFLALGKAPIPVRIEVARLVDLVFFM